MTYSTKNKGFTLVELAIVIVIIGFLVAGIAAGANMIRQAELRSLITDMQQYQVAYNNFIGRFNKVPGDMEVASSFWPATTGTTSCGSTATFCDGNGNGRIAHGTTVATNEVLKAWKQLALAGTISAGIQQITGSTGLITIGTEAPVSKKAGAGFFMAAGGAAYGSGAAVSQFATTTNAVFIGRGGLAASALVNPALTTEEAYNLDVKLDDGLVSGAGVFTGANTGVVRAHDGNGITAATLGTSCTTAAVGGTYDITSQNAACVVGLALN